MPTVAAGSAEIPALGFGTFQLSGEDCTRAVRAALEAGYRHVDTAEYYDNERAVGRALSAAPVDREEVFLTTKVWRSNLRAGDVRPAVEASLDRLGVDSVDLLLVHWPHPRIPIAETLRAMERLRDDGLVRHLGVSNFTADQLREALAVADAPLVTDQVQYHPYVDQRDLLSVCRDEDVALTAYSPLAQGAVLDDANIAAIGQRYDKSPAQVTLRWLLQQEGVVAIPRSSTPEHVKANAEVFDFALTDEEMARIHGLTGGLRMRIQNVLPALMRAFPL